MAEMDPGNRIGRVLRDGDDRRQPSYPAMAMGVIGFPDAELSSVLQASESGT